MSGRCACPGADVDCAAVLVNVRWISHHKVLVCATHLSTTKRVGWLVEGAAGRSSRFSAPCPLLQSHPCSFLPSLEWYVDSMLTLMERAGESAMNDLWHSVVQVCLSG